MSLSKYKPVMTYLEHSSLRRLKMFSKKHKMPMAQVVREAIEARIAGGDPFTAGHNMGIVKCMDVIDSVEVAKLMFPSGRTLAVIINDQLNDLKIKGVKDEPDGAA